MSARFKVLDLFSGCGGLGLGFDRRHGFEVVLAVDSWNHAVETHQRNQPLVPARQADLASKCVTKEICSQLAGDIDVVIGGPPCQPFSTLGKRSDADDRANLVDTFCDCVQSIQPKLAVMENVRGFASRALPDGMLFPERVKRRLWVRSRLRKRYVVADGLVDLGGAGLAQSRPRWLTFALREDIGGLADVGRLLESVRAAMSGDLLPLSAAIADLPRVPPAGGALVTEAGSDLIHNHQSLRHSRELIRRLSYVPPGGGLLDVPRRLLTPHLKRLVDGEYGSGGHVKNIYGRLSWDAPCGTIVAGIDKITCGRFVHPTENRLLTPRECARIQSFDDAFIFPGSLVAAYYLIGNAVPPKAATAIALACRHVLSQKARRASLKITASAR